MTEGSQLKRQLDRSCDLIEPRLEQQLKARVNLAQSQSQRRAYRFGYAVAPLALFAAVWFGVADYNSLSDEELAIYDDLELLIAEDELDFLHNMDVSDWVLEPTDATDA